MDEKWFDLTPQQMRLYLTQNEIEEGNELQRKTRSKHYIEKVMFLCAVACPHFNDDGECIFDGKIGLWPFVEKVLRHRGC